MASLADSHPDQASEPLGLPGAMPPPISVLMLGAGSFFTGSILKDILLIPGGQGGELRLVDIDERRLRLSEQWMRNIVGHLPDGDRWTVKASTAREDLLPGTDYIVNAIEVSG